ncbi:hypothetical protein QJS04_geneDACA016774 [Acorus gramineus]|uniref:Uncharacterized protein n=1 Tax=Acorus gramineus TaxID=55184 RepID=A0AAV9BIE8_ACOGR|nr:hypothetical protein QJS04_geneDACA016774 [Acorus gramineus]
MVETLSAPSELHLKKELTALRKARFLRDPETCSSWRSPLSSRSTATRSGQNLVNCGRGKSSNISNPGGEIGSSLPQRTENFSKKVFLHNWMNHSIKSSDNETKLDGQMSEDSLNNGQKMDYKDNVNLEHPEMVFGRRNINSETSTRRMARKFRKRTSVKCGNRMSANLGMLNSLNTNELSDDTEYCNSEDQQLSSDNTILASSASPLQTGHRNGTHVSKASKNARTDDSTYSYTPASSASYNRYRHRDPNTTGSWDGTTTSFDGDEVDRLQLSQRQGCGIPCYWSRRTKSRSSGGCYSPSLSSILCGSQSLYQKRRSSPSYKQKILSNSSQGLPLLNNSCNVGGSLMDSPSDGIATNFGELDLEALSRLDGRRWSSCRSQDALESVVDERSDLVMPDHRSLSKKYQPRSFDDIIGQNIVVQSLVNAISRGRVAPAYLFQGPRGTGKTSTARVFAAALNCLSSEDNKPCQLCRECTNFASGTSTNMQEVEAANKKGMDRVRYLLKNLSTTSAFSRYKIFVVDECHMLSSKTWLAFLAFLEEPPSHVVFIFTSTNPNNVPRAVISRCQKYLFPKIKDGDIITRLRKISVEENLDIELDALDLMAMNSDGSLRDAETLLDQLSLLGKRITTTLVNDLVGIVSDEKLLDLLEIAMSSDTAETVKRSRELMNSGVEPMALMSQLAALIMDIIAGTYQLVNSKCSGSLFSGRSLTEAEVARLQQALTVLSEAEKQLRHSSERSTWFTAALLQLGSGQMPESTSSSRSSKKSTRTMKKDEINIGQGECASVKISDSLITNRQSKSCPIVGVTNRCSSPLCNPSSSKSMRVDQNHKSLGVCTSADKNEDSQADANPYTCASPQKLEEIWRGCIERCHSTTLKQLLNNNGKLVSVSEVEGVLIAFIAFKDSDVKSRAERYLSSITNSIEMVLRHNVEVRIGVMPENMLPNSSMDEAFSQYCSSNEDPINDSPTQPRKHPIPPERKAKTANDVHIAFTLEGNNGVFDTNQRALESAWLQVTEKGTPASNQVLPHDGVGFVDQMKSSKAPEISSRHWEDELNDEIKTLKMNRDGIRTAAHHPMSPSLLHSNSFAINLNQDNLGYESGPSCNGLLCWKTRKANAGNIRR